MRTNQKHLRFRELTDAILLWKVGSEVVVEGFHRNDCIVLYYMNSHLKWGDAKDFVASGFNLSDGQLNEHRKIFEGRDRVVVTDLEMFLGCMV